MPFKEQIIEKKKVSPSQSRDQWGTEVHILPKWFYSTVIVCVSGMSHKALITAYFYIKHNIFNIYLPKYIQELYY